MEIKSRSEIYQLLPPKFVAAELGIAEGLYSEQLLKMGAGKLYMVDAWQHLDQSGDGGSPQSWHNKNYAEALARVREYGRKAVILRGMTYEMVNKVPDGTLDLLYIDADHSYPGALTDLSVWYPKVKSGGVIAGHDILNPNYGVGRAVSDFCNTRGYKMKIIPEDHPSNASFYFFKK